MSQPGEDRDGRVDEYEPPKVEDLDTGNEPAVTAAGVDSIVG